MQKFFLSAFVIFSFVIYAISLRGKNTAVQAAISDPPAPAVANSGMGMMGNRFKNGTYIGSVADAYYGNVQVQITISGGKITDVTFLDYPHDRQTSQMINSQAMPDLKSEVIQAQNANVDVVSGATATSEAFIQSLQSALAKAQ